MLPIQECRDAAELYLQTHTPEVTFDLCRANYPALQAQVVREIVGEAGVALASKQVQAVEKPQFSLLEIEKPDTSGEFSSPLAGALFMASRGVPQIPLRPRSKSAFLEGWPTLSTTDLEQIKKWSTQYANCNFGSVAKRDGILIFETDSSDVRKRFAGEFSSEFLVQSSTSERGHRYYKNSGIANISQKDNKHGDFSLRADDMYCCSPGSIHPESGKQYRLVSDGAIAEPSREEIEFWNSERKSEQVKTRQSENRGEPGFQKLFDAVGWKPLIDRLNKHRDSRFHSPVLEPGELMYCPMPGHYKPEDMNRQFTTTPFGVVDGSMLHCFGCEFTGDMIAACNTLDSNSSGGLVASISMFETARGICEENGLKFEDYFPPAVESVEAEITDEIVEEPLPDFPRLSGSLSELSDALYPNIPYDFKVMAAVTHFGLIRSGLDKLEGEPHLQPRFYTCFIKEPGWGKTAALNEVRNCMKIIGRHCVTSSVDSGPALVDEFTDCAAKIPPMSEDKSARLLLDPDEMRDLFEKSKVSPQSRNSLFTELLKLYESNRTGNRSRKAGKSQLENAHLAILGGATPQGYETMWTGTGGGSSGLQSRFVLVTTNEPRMPVNKAASNIEALSASISRLQKQAGQSGQIIRMSDQAATILRDWWGGSARDKSSESRVEDMVKRLCIVLAVTNDTVTVGPDLMRQAIQFGDYVIAVREKFNPADSHSWTQAFENQIITVAERRKIAMTMNDFRRLIHPHRKPGGLGPYLQAWKNTLAAGILKLDGKTVQGTGKYRL
jgi:hypothetical protein